MPSRELMEAAERSLSRENLAQEATRAPERLLRIREVKFLTGKSRTGIYTDPSFPRPIKISNLASAWVGSEVDHWIAERVRISRSPQRAVPAASKTA